MKTITINPQIINQGSQAGKRIITKYDKNNKPVYAKSLSKCVDGNATPSYHPWEENTLQNFIKGGAAQCGRGSRYNCDTKTVWNGIKGYRNVCPIAGICGTFNTPANLYLSSFNLREKGLTQEATINSLEFVYEHGMKGVYVATGEKVKDCGDFPFVDISLYYQDITTQGGQIGNLIETKRFNTKVPANKYGTVKVNFSNFNFNPLKQNLIVQIKYPMQGNGQMTKTSTNPCIIYIKGLDVKLSYTPKEQPIIYLVDIVSNEDSRYITTEKTREFCRTTATHYLQVKINNSYSSSREIYVNEQKLPAGMEYTTKYDSATETKQFIWTDTSGIVGYKYIEYCLKSNNKIVTKSIAVAVIDPQLVRVQCINTFIKGSQFIPKEEYITVPTGCFKQIQVYIDSINNTPLVFDRKSGLNLIYDENDQVNCYQKFYNAIKELSCGNHKLFIYYDWLFLREQNLHIVPQTINLNIDYQFYIEGQEFFTQSQIGAIDERDDDGVPTSNSYFHRVFISRDGGNEQENLSITLSDTSNPKNKPQQLSLKVGESLYQDINISTPGTYYINATYNNGCKDVTQTFPFTVVARHVQYYDQLLIKGLGSNSDLECTSIILREGDGLRYPVCMENIQNQSALEDIKLYGSNGYARLLQLGSAVLLVENTTSNDINNLYIEMNPFVYIDDNNIDALVTEWNDGMLKNFINNFYELNPNLQGLVDIINLTEDNDVIEEEDVFLNIKNIKPNKQIYIKIPFVYKKTRLINMEFLIMGQSTDIISLDDDTILNNLILSVDDLIANELFIEGDLDVNNTDCCQSDISYIIKNVDTIETADQAKTTKIINSPQMKPIAYKRYNDDDFIDVNYVNGVYQTTEKDITFTRKNQDKTIPLANEKINIKYLNKNKIMESKTVITNNDGIVNFDYIIPNYFGQNSYTINQILQQLVQIEYKGNIEYRPNVIGTNLDLIKTHINILGFRIDNEWITDINQVVNKDSHITLYGILLDVDNFPIESIIDSQTDINTQSAICNMVDSQIIDEVDFNIYHNIIKNYKDDFTKQYNLTTDYHLIEQHVNKGLFKLPIYLTLNKDTTLKDILQNQIYVKSRETHLYKSTEIGNIEISTFKDKRAKSILYVSNNYLEYAPNTLVTLTIHLNSTISVFQNTIDIKQKLIDNKYSNKIRYKLCEQHSGTYQTNYKTNDTTLMPNNLQKNVYCNVPTSLTAKARLEKQIIEQNDLNTLLINITNGSKPNKDVSVLIYIGELTLHTGDYNVIEAINLANGQYSYDENLDVITWNIGDMEPYQTIDGNIRLSAEKLGDNIIRLYAYDYLNQPDDIQTIYTFLSLQPITETYSVGDNIPLISHLSDIYAELDSTEKIYFMDNNTNKTLAVAYTKENVDTHIREAKGYFQPIISGTFNIQARYAGKLTDSSKYISSVSDIITLNVVKIDTQVEFDCAKNEIAIDTGAIIKVYLKHNNKIINRKDINVSYYVNNSKLISGITEEKDYTEIKFVPTEIGAYVLHVVIQEDDKYKGKTVDYTINVL